MRFDPCEAGTCSHIACRPSDDDSTPAQRGELPAILTTLPEDVTSAGQARDLAIEWQHWAGEQSLSWGDVAGMQARLEALAERFDLADDFRENGVI